MSWIQNRCQASTVKGTQCKKGIARVGGQYCKLHEVVKADLAAKEHTRCPECGQMPDPLVSVSEIAT